MKDNFFIDTNIIVYLFDDRYPKKQKISKDIMHKGLKDRAGKISFQVIQEFTNVAINKFEETILKKDLTHFIKKILLPLNSGFQSVDLINKAIEINYSHSISFYDALILSATIEANCKVLYTEDMEHGFKIDGVKVVNPFV